MKLVSFSSLLVSRQRGTAVVMALLTVALVAGIAASAMGDLGIALDGTIGLHDQAEARLLARGTVDWARNVLANDARTTTVDHFGESWAIKVPPIALEDSENSELSGELKELSGRFNLGNLVRNGRPSEVDITCFVNLLRLLGVADGEAVALANALLDWMDADMQPSLPGGAELAWYAGESLPQRPPNSTLVDVMELTQVRGFSAALVERLKPLVVALPSGTSINVNTAPAEVLAALLPGLGLDGAQQLLVQREQAWFKDIADFKARLPQSVTGFDADHLSTRSQYFLVVARGHYGVSMVQMETLLERKQNWPNIVWQRSL